MRRVEGSIIVRHQREPKLLLSEIPRNRYVQGVYTVTAFFNIYSVIARARKNMSDFYFFFSQN